MKLEDSTLRALKSYAWPGNIRELENALEWAVNMAPGDTIGVSDLPEHIKQALLTTETEENLPAPEQEILPEEMEKELIRAALQHNAGNISEASKTLNINRRSLYRKMEQYGIDITDFRKETDRNGGAK